MLILAEKLLLDVQFVLLKLLTFHGLTSNFFKIYILCSY